MLARLPATADRFDTGRDTAALSFRAPGRVIAVMLLLTLVALPERACARAAATTSGRVTVGGNGAVTAGTEPTDGVRFSNDGLPVPASVESPRPSRSLLNTGAGRLVPDGPGGPVVTLLLSIGLVLVAVGATGMARHRT